MRNTFHCPAIQRIYNLLDDNSFVETGALIIARNTDFIKQDEENLSDGVITGHGLIDGNLVFVYSQDYTVLNGTIGEMHAKKIADLYKQAIKMNAPVIGLIDCGGIRLHESFDALNSLGELYRMQALASGKILQICAVFGMCGGGLNILPALADFVYLEENSKMFIHTPDAVKDNKKEVLDFSTPLYQSEHTKVVDKVLAESEIYEQIKTLILILPRNFKEDCYIAKTEDNLNRECKNIQINQEDILEIITEVSDDHSFYETKENFGKDIRTGFIRLNGMTIGTLANAKINGKSLLSADGCKKAADFILFCDAFRIPLLTLAQVTGFIADIKTEQELARAGAAFVYACANSKSAKVTLICGDCYTSAAMFMNTKALGADVVYAWPSVKYGILNAKTAIKLMPQKEQNDDLKASEKEFASKQTDIITAAKHGYIDSIIEPCDTRKYLIDAFEMLYTKNENIFEKRHGAHSF